ncbi:hypothetical protein KAR91_74880 [Candidatus Pacearchaeota archaeon]|nr:hypothetical protein [Candidatus Pacearchaeota archaeon]
MRIMCWYCNKIVSSEALDDFAFRAIAICPECIEKSPEAENHPLNKDAVLTNAMHSDGEGCMVQTGKTLKDMCKM